MVLQKCLIILQFYIPRSSERKHVSIPTSHSRQDIWSFPQTAFVEFSELQQIPKVIWYLRYCISSNRYIPRGRTKNYISITTSEQISIAIRDFHKHTKLAILAKCKFCIPIYLQFPSLFLHYVSKCEITYQCVQENYISKLQTSLVQFVSDGTAKIKLAILAFLYCGEFVKNSIEFIRIFSINTKFVIANIDIK